MKVAIFKKEQNRKRESVWRLEKVLGKEQLAEIRRGSLARQQQQQHVGGGGGSSYDLKVGSKSISDDLGSLDHAGAGGYSAASMSGPLPQPHGQLRNHNAAGGRSHSNLARPQSMVFSSQREMASLVRPQSMVLSPSQRELGSVPMMPSPGSPPPPPAINSDHALPRRSKIVKGERPNTMMF
ncbi:UNVERIFIED_CONTAM: hypothetical protein HDU68_011149 [Siphonaria sp. JEL0065]|nr:hypothetical protein HDU68_011149 [Siphonaria sp. JEL0065]